jgi:hypothetical protein
MKLSDRIRRWWKPAEWRDEHPQVTEGGEGHPLSEEERAEDRELSGGTLIPETKPSYADEE